MKLSFLSILFLALLMVTAPTAWAQSGNSTDQSKGQAASGTSRNSSVPAAQGTTDSTGQDTGQATTGNGSSSDVASGTSTSASPMTPWLPNAVNGETGSLDFLSSGERSNWVSAGISMMSTYDDNALSSSSQKVGNFGYMISPDISLQENRTRTALSFAYSPGFTMNQRLSPRYNAAHNLNLNFQYRLTEHLTARLHDGLLYGTTSFDRASGPDSLVGNNVLHQPNQAIVTPLTNQLTNYTGLDLIDQVGESTMVGASGTFSTLHFLGSPSTPDVTLANSQGWSGDVFYSTRIFARHSIGFTFSHQNLATYGDIGERADSNSLLLFYTFYVKPRLSISFFGGPNHSVNRMSDGKQSQWLLDAGATVGWQGLRTSLQLGAIHHVSDGGGLTGANRTYSVTFGVQRQVTRNLSTNFDLSYSHNSPLGQLGGNSFYAVNGTAGIERTIAQKVSVALMYGRNQQNFNSPVFASNTLANHNRACQ